MVNPLQYFERAFFMVRFAGLAFCRHKKNPVTAQAVLTGGPNSQSKVASLQSASNAYNVNFNNGNVNNNNLNNNNKVRCVRSRT